VAGRRSSQERPGLVDRVARRARQLRARAADRRARPVEELRRCARPRGERAHVVLGEVVGEQQAVAEEVARHHAVLLRRAVQAVIDAADRRPQLAVVPRRLTGERERAAAVEVVADRDRQVLLALGDGRVLQRPERERVGEDVLGVLGQPVAAEVPDDAGEVAEHPEVVRHALGRHVPHVGADAGGHERVDVLLRVAG
jgi:hypothetical protein